MMRNLLLSVLASLAVTLCSAQVYKAGGGTSSGTGSVGRYVIVTNNVNIAVADNTATVLTFSHALSDTYNMHANGSADLIAASTKPHFVFVNVSWPSGTAGTKHVYVRHISGSTTNIWAEQSGNAVNYTSGQNTSHFLPLISGDKVQAVVVQNSGDTIDCLAVPFYGLTFGMYELP